MKLAILQPYYHTIGGTEKNAIKLVKELGTRLGDAFVIVPGEGEFSALARNEGIRVVTCAPPEILNTFGGAYFHYGLTKAWRFLVAFFRYNLKLARELHREGVTVVLHNHVRAPVIMGLAPILAHIPAILYVRDDLPSGTSRFEPLVRMWFAISTTAIIAVSDASLHSFVKRMPAIVRRLAARKGKVVHNWLPDSLLEIKQPIPRSSPRPIIGTLAVIVPRKGIHHLVEMAATLHDSGHEFELWIAGKAEDREYLAQVQRYVHEHHLSTIVRFCGYVRPYEFLASIDVFVLASDREGMPMAVLEAMQTGIPIVAFAAEGVEEALGDSRAGITVPVGDVKMLTEQVSQLLRNPDVRLRMGRSGQERSKFFSKERIVNELVSIILGLANA